MDLKSKRNHPLGQYYKLSKSEILYKIEALQNYVLNLPIVLYFLTNA